MDTDDSASTPHAQALGAMRLQRDHWRRMAGEAYALLEAERQNHRDLWDRVNNEKWQANSVTLVGRAGPELVLDRDEQQ